MNKILIFLSITGLINAITSTVLAIMVYLSNRTNPVNRAYTLFALYLAFWSYAYIFWPIARSKEECLFWFRVLHLGAILIPVGFYHFVLRFLGKDSKTSAKVSYPLALFFMVFSFSPYFIPDMRPISCMPYYGTIGPLYIPFLIMFHYYAGLALYLLFADYKDSPPQKKSQILFVGVGMIIGFLGGCSNFLPWFGVPIPPVLNALGAVYVLMAVLAIVKYQFLDIVVVIKKTAVYSVIVAIITSVYFILILLFEKMFCGVVGYNSVYVTVLIIIIFTLVFTPLKNCVRACVDRYFFKGTIDQIDKERQQLLEQLVKTERLKAVSTLAAGMAHEIKNPLTAIKTFAEYLPQKYTDKEFVDKFSLIVGNEAERINKIVKDLLEFSKPKELELKPSKINDIIEETISLLNNDIVKRGIKVQKEYAGLPVMNVDPIQMKQVFLNILLNAIDAIEGEGTITIKTAQAGEKVTISIADTGIGMSERDLAHIFDPFFTKKKHGTGLGLSVVHGIIERHNGKINVKSKVGVGTTFEIVL